MENKAENNNTTGDAKESNNIANITEVKTVKVKKLVLECCLRRKNGLISIPGQDPNERVYKIGSSIDGRSGGSLKGISGELEKLFMPEIVQVGANDFGFKKAVDEYWANISKPVPADELYLKDFEQGIKIRLKFTIKGEIQLKKYETATTLEEKVEVLNDFLVKKYLDSPTEKVAVLNDECIADYLLLTYLLKYNKVANVPQDVDKSPKIVFYLYEKSTAVKSTISFIDLKDKAIKLFGTIREDTNKLDSVLFALGFNALDYTDIYDKVIAVDSRYMKDINTINLFIKAAEDSNYKVRLLINKALATAKLNVPPNTTSIYYNDKLLGTSIEGAIDFLLNNEIGQEVKISLEQEVKNI